MKYLIAAAVLAFSGSLAWSQDQAASAQTPPSLQVSVPLGNTSLDLGSVIKQLHPGYFYDQHGDQLAGGYIHLVSLHDASGTVFVDLNGALNWYAQDHKGVSAGTAGPTLAIGFRADNIGARAQSQSWMKTHVTAIKLPAVEGGPFGGIIPHIGWVYGLWGGLAF